MNKTHLLFGFFLLQFACQSGTNESTETTTEAVDSTSTANETVNEPAIEQNLKVKIFFLSDSYDEEGNLLSENVSERENFQAENGYVFCYDSESFHSLTLEGNGTNFTLIVTADGTVEYENKDFELQGEKTFTNKDFELGGGGSYTIQVLQQGQELFNGEVSSQGCM